MEARRHEALSCELERSRLSAALVTGATELEDQLDVASLLQGFADLLVRSTPHFRLAWFYVGDPQAPRITPDYCAGVESEYGRGLVVDRSPLMMWGPVRRALESGEPVAQDVPLSLGAKGWLFPGIRQWHQRALEAGVRSVLAQPFSLTDSDQWALTVLYADTEGYFDEVGLKPFDALGRLVRVGLDRLALREAEQRSRADLHRARLEDPLTGLPNQAGFDIEWRHWMTRHLGTPLLVYLDIDDFGALNAGIGREAGDEVLRSVARRLSEVSSEAAVIARVGPDEFLIGTELADPAQAGPDVEQYQAAVNRNLAIGGRDLAISVTAGYAVGGDAAPEAEHAALALREAKNAGAGSRRAYSGALAPDSAAPQDLFAQLRHAKDRDELALFYQPQVDLTDSDVVVGAEALIRWYGSDGRLIPPGSFIPAVEASAMIRDIGCWVLDAAARPLYQGADGGPPVVGINIGARHLLHPRFLEDVDALLSRFPGVAGRLSIEITEAAAMTDIEATRQVLAGLRTRGLGVALDDFGTGFASYSQLATLPVDQIKIDRQFVDGLDHAPRSLALVESLLVAAEGLGIGVVAEGIEYRVEGDVLGDIGCRVGQGYGYAHPMDAASFDAWCAQRPTTREPAVPVMQPVMAVVCRLIAMLRAEEAGVETAQGPMAPAWFRRLLGSEPDVASAIQALAEHRRCRERDAVARQASRARALESLQAVKTQLNRRLWS